MECASSGERTKCVADRTKSEMLQMSQVLPRRRHKRRHKITGLRHVPMAALTVRIHHSGRMRKRLVGRGVTDVIVATAQADVRITFLRPGRFQTPVGIVTPKQRTPGSVAQLFVKAAHETAKLPLRGKM
jgi:hypothetical protein